MNQRREFGLMGEQGAESIHARFNIDLRDELSSKRFKLAVKYISFLNKYVLLGSCKLIVVKCKTYSIVHASVINGV